MGRRGGGDITHHILHDSVSFRNALVYFLVVFDLACPQHTSLLEHPRRKTLHKIAVARDLVSENKTFHDISQTEYIFAMNNELKFYGSAQNNKSCNQEKITFIRTRLESHHCAQ